MSRRTTRPEQGLLTRAERYMLRVDARDLKAQIQRATDPAERARLEQLLANVVAQQRDDKESLRRSARS